MTVAILAYIIFATIGVGFFIVGAANDTTDNLADELAEANRAASMAELSPLHDRSNGR